MQRFLMLGGILLVLVAPAMLMAQTLPPDPASGRAERSPAPTDGGDGLGSVEVGIGGIYRVGCWTGIRLPSAADTANVVQRVETLDGDGVRVRFQQAQAGASQSSAPEHLAWRYAVPGSATAPLRLYDARDELLWQGRFPASAIDPATPWVVAIGDTLGLEAIGRSELLGREASVAVARITAAVELPDQAAGWDGVDLLVINPAGVELLGELKQDRIGAIADWLTSGGRLLVSLGKDGEAMLSSAPWLAELIELPQRGESVRLDPAALETYTSSQSPLSTLDGYALPARGGRTLISGRTTTRQPARLVIERMIGLGRVIITAFAPDSPEMAAWPQRTALIARLHPGLLDIETQRRREARTTAAVAYDDLAGQIRAALDRFDSHQRTPFSLIALMLLVVAALIGPLDYWLVNRVFGKPLLGWLSFPLSVLLLSGLVLVLSARGSSPASAGGASETDAAHRGLRTNRIEIIDINAVPQQPVGRGLSLTHVSSPDATLVDFDVDVLPELSRSAISQSPGEASARAQGSRGAAIPRPLTGPYGYPGTTFGGISIAGEDRSLPAYDLVLRDGAAGHSLGRSAALAGGPVGFPIPAAGSKGWMTRWAFEPNLGETSGLSQRRGSELLAGSVANPLDVDLLNGVLVYGNWAYLLPTRFRAGQRIPSIDSLRQKNFRWHLSRRELSESSSRIDTWNVQMHDDLERLTEILMFESASGGRDYTGLSNRPLSGLDLSHVLTHGHAILYGHLPGPLLQTDLPAERPAVSAVRIILPVAAATLRAR